MEWKIPTEMLEHEKKIQDLKSKLSEYENKLEIATDALEFYAVRERGIAINALKKINPEKYSDL